MPEAQDAPDRDPAYSGGGGVRARDDQRRPDFFQSRINLLVSDHPSVALARIAGVIEDGRPVDRKAASVLLDSDQSFLERNLHFSRYCSSHGALDRNSATAFLSVSFNVAAT